MSDSPPAGLSRFGTPCRYCFTRRWRAQIDVDVFTDPVSGKSYLYQQRLHGAELNDDMVSIKENTVTVMTPEEAPCRTMLSAKQPMSLSQRALLFHVVGRRYRFAHYHVAYGTSKSPLVLSKLPSNPLY